MNPGDSFSIFIVPEINAEKMKIPPPFVSRLRSLDNDVVILRDRHRTTWRVSVSKVGHDWFFDNGWMKFYKENRLKWGDNLLFEYKGDNMFHFKLLGGTACEEKGIGYLRVQVKEEEEEDDDDDFDDDDEDDFDDDDEDDHVKVKEEEMDEEEEIEDDEEEESEDEEEMSDEEESEDEEEEEEDIKPKSRLHLGKRKLNMGNKKSGVLTTTSKRMQNNAPYCYGPEIFESGLVPRPKNPYFVTRSRKERRKNELLIPKHVIEDYNLNLPEKLFLVDKKGNQWETKIMCWNDGRVCLSRGWRGLCVVNNIKRDDVCICEFVKRKNDEGRDILVYAVNSIDRK